MWFGINIKLGHITDMLKKKAVSTKPATQGKQVAIQPTKKAVSQHTKPVSSQPTKQTKTTVNPKVKLAKPDVHVSTKSSDKPTVSRIDSTEKDDTPEIMHDSKSPSKPLKTPGRPESPTNHTQPSDGVEQIFMDVKPRIWTDTIRAHFSGTIFSTQVTGCCFMPNGELVICDKPNQLVQTYNTIFSNQGSVFLPASPFDIAALDNKNVVVTMPEHKILQLIQVLPKRQKGILKLLGHCKGGTS